MGKRLGFIRNVLLTSFVYCQCAWFTGSDVYSGILMQAFPIPLPLLTVKGPLLASFACTKFLFKLSVSLGLKRYAFVSNYNFVSEAVHCQKQPL